MRRILMAAVVGLALTACGGGGSSGDAPSGTPEGLPALVNGWVNWWDVQETPGHFFGVVNATGAPMVQVDVYTTTGMVTFPVYIAPGALWVDLDDEIAPGTVLVRATQQGGRTFARYFTYDGAGRDAAAVSNANWELDF